MEPLHACTTPTSVLAGQYASKRVAVGEDGETADLKIWDTAGQRKYRAITTAYYTGAAGVLLVYDVAAAPSFDECDAWLAVRRAWRRMRPLWTHPALYFHAPQEIRAHAAPGVPVVLVGNKVDLAEAGERAVEQDAARAFAEVRRVLAGCLRARDDPRRALPSRCRSTTSALLSVQRAAALACRMRSDSSPGQCGSVSRPRLRRPPPQRRRLSPQKNERFVPVGVKTCHWQLRDSGLPLVQSMQRRVSNPVSRRIVSESMRALLPIRFVLQLRFYFRIALPMQGSKGGNESASSSAAASKPPREASSRGWCCWCCWTLCCCCCGARRHGREEAAALLADARGPTGPTRRKPPPLAAAAAGAAARGPVSADGATARDPDTGRLSYR